MGIYTIAITGASGAPYARRVLQALLQLGHHVKLVVSPAGAQVLDIELGFRPRGGVRSHGEQWLAFLDMAPGQGGLEVLGHKNFSASIASGSFQVDGMAIVPCSMGTLARIATGASTNLIERAADVCLKERRRLVLVPRETPLNVIHLRNIQTLAEAGVDIVPAMPGFYHHPRSIDDLVDMLAGRILDRLGVPNDLFKRWQGDPLAELSLSE